MSPGRRAQGAGSGGDVEAEAALERVEELDRLDAGAARARLEVQPLTRAVLAHGDEVCSTASGDVGGGVGGVPRLPCGACVKTYLVDCILDVFFMFWNTIRYKQDTNGIRMDILLRENDPVFT